MADLSRGLAVWTKGCPTLKPPLSPKPYASDMAFNVTNEAIQLHGGYGYVNEYPVEKLLRDVKLNQIYEGTI